MAGRASSRRAPTVVVEQLEGLRYEPEFATEEEEAALVALFEQRQFSEIHMRGQVARRTVLHFGYRYDYEGWTLVPVEPLPPSATWVRDRAATLAEVDPAALAETLVTRYPPGAGIGWHRDAPLFGPKVVGVTLLSGCSLRFQRRRAGIRELHVLELAPRSAYVLAGSACQRRSKTTR